MTDAPNPARRLLEQAQARYHAGDHPAAQALYEQALALCEQVAGPDHPDIVLALYVARP